MAINKYLVFLLLLAFQGCSSQPLNYIEKQNYDSLWVWQLNIGRIDTSFTPYQQTKQKNIWQNGELFKSIFTKSFSNHIYKRFIALGFEGEIKINILRLLASKMIIDNQINYDMNADIHFVLNTPKLVLEEFWNLKTTHQSLVILSDISERLLIKKMINNLMFQLHEHTGINLHNKLQPLIIK